MWKISPSQLILGENEVHLWLAELASPKEQTEVLIKFLSPDEIVRWERFRFPQHQQRFLVARANLRKILSLYLDIQPALIEFSYTAKGKPQLADKFDNFKLEFNLSHSENLALYAITNTKKIGIDIEFIRPFPEAIKIARRFFTNQEYEKLLALKIEEQPEAFLQLWTTKEAYLKATGEGLSGSLDRVEIINLVRENKFSWRCSENVNWLFYSFSPAANYLATLAIEEGNDRNFHFWKFQS